MSGTRSILIKFSSDDFIGMAVMSNSKNVIKDFRMVSVGLNEINWMDLLLFARIKLVTCVDKSMFAKFFIEYQFVSDNRPEV